MVPRHPLAASEQAAGGIRAQWSAQRRLHLRRDHGLLLPPLLHGSCVVAGQPWVGQRLLRLWVPQWLPWQPLTMSLHRQRLQLALAALAQVRVRVRACVWLRPARSAAVVAAAPPPVWPLVPQLPQRSHEPRPF